MFAPMAELTGSQSQQCCLLPAFPAVCEGVSAAGSAASCSHQLWGRAHFLAAQPAGCVSWSQQHQPFLPLHNMRDSPPSLSQLGDTVGAIRPTGTEISSVESRETYLLGVFRISHLVIYVRHHLQRATQRGHGLPGGQHSTGIHSMALAHPPSPSPRVIPPVAMAALSICTSLSSCIHQHTAVDTQNLKAYCSSQTLLW